MFSIEYINIPTLIAILVIAYLMDDVFLFMKLGNDTTKQLMATVVGYIIAVRKFGYLRFEPFANRFGEENPLYAMGFMREKSQKSKWAAYQRGIFFWQAVTLVLAIMSKIAFILSQRFVFSDFEIVAVYMCSFLRISCVSFLVILIGYVVTWSYYMLTYHRSFRYYAGRDKVWKPFSFVGQDHYYVWPNELKVLPRTCASIYPYEEDDHVKENIKKSCVADGYEKEREFDFSDQGNAVFMLFQNLQRHLTVLSLYHIILLRQNLAQQLAVQFIVFYNKHPFFTHPILLPSHHPVISLSGNPPLRTALPDMPELHPQSSDSPGAPAPGAEVPRRAQAQPCPAGTPSGRWPTAAAAQIPGWHSRP